MNNLTLGRGEQRRLFIENPEEGELKITLADGARLGLDIIEDSAAAAFNLAVTVSLAANARLDLNFATLDCTAARNDVNIDLNGVGSAAQVNGLVLADGEQQVSYSTRIAHHCEHSSSDQLFKYVADGNSRCRFNGRIIVDRAARFTEAYQTNRNLLASAGARMHAEPTLEIYCDEVKCSHGAATGQLDEQALFYMRQRGIPLETARRMLMQAFVADVAARFADEAARDSLLKRIDRKFSTL